MQLSLRPGSFLAISAHLLPMVLCSMNIFFSSSQLIGSFLMYGSKWLCHLIHTRQTIGNLPLATLLASPAADTVLFPQALGDEGPPLRAEFPHQIHNRIVFLQTQTLALRTIPVARKHNNLRIKSIALTV
jgi:hypothetical protein